MTVDPADLRLRIDEAFGGMPYPGDEHIVYDTPGYNGAMADHGQTRLCGLKPA